MVAFQLWLVKRRCDVKGSYGTGSLHRSRLEYNVESVSGWVGSS
jgi:hypothetical protein